MRALRNNHGLGPGHSRAQAEAVDCKWRDSGERGRVFRIAAEKYTGLMMVPLPSPSSTSFGLRVLNLSRSPTQAGLGSEAATSIPTASSEVFAVVLEAQIYVCTLNLYLRQALN